MAWTQLKTLTGRDPATVLPGAQHIDAFSTSSTMIMMMTVSYPQCTESNSELSANDRGRGREHVNICTWLRRGFLSFFKEDLFI